MKRFTDKLESGKAALLVCFALAMMVWGVFGQTLRHEFVNFDDNMYVYENPDVSQGLNRTGISKAFTSRYIGIWLPLTMLSYQLDHELSGMDPARFHRTNVLLHAASSIALFLVLRSMTGSLWRSAFVAALFAIHPLRAESVAWVSERKDVLSGLFFMLTLGAYAHYTRARHRKQLVVSGRYLLVVLLFTLGLMSKPILVTLPFVLLLLDFWPLARLETIGAKKLILEKLPLFLLATVSCAVAVWTQRDTITVDEDVTLLWRIGNAVVSYVVYIKQMIAPFELAMLYPHPGTELPLWHISASFILLMMISLTAVFAWKRRPYLTVGWLWYLGMLVPVIGIMQVGVHAHADRYTYLSQIGLTILLTWGTAELSARWRQRRAILGATALVLLAGLGTRAWTQTSYWRNSEVLWTHTLAHTEDNKIANYNLAVALERRGKSEMAIEQYRRALQVWPEDAEALINLGCALAEQKEFKTAAELYRRALEIKPDSPEAHTDLGIVLAKQGQIETAMEHYRQALRTKPDYLEAHINMGVLSVKQGQIETAIEHYRQALKIKPDSAYAHYNLGVALTKQGKTQDAISHLQKAWKIDPNSELAQRSLNMANKLLLDWADPD